MPEEATEFSVKNNTWKILTTLNQVNIPSTYNIFLIKCHDLSEDKVVHRMNVCILMNSHIG